jgi:hypothetical protein
MTGEEQKLRSPMTGEQHKLRSPMPGEQMLVVCILHV